MLTRNYYIGLLASTFGNTLPVSASFRLSINGSYNKSRGIGFIRLLPTELITTNYYDDGLGFGTSDAEETFDDYNIGTVCDFTETVGTYYEPTYNPEDKTYTLTRRYVLTNNTNTPLTVNCFGIFGELLGDRQNSLLYRKKLDTPFTVDVGETVNFDLTIAYEMVADFEPYVPA